MTKARSSSLDTGIGLDPIDMTSTEFEKFVGSMFSKQYTSVSNFHVEHLQEIPGIDGTYEVDVLITFDLLGVLFKVLVECKRHRHPIKRDVVQVLESRLRSTGSQKGMLFSTSAFQKGAIDYATAHGIALIHIADGNAFYQTRSLSISTDRPQNNPRAVGWIVTSTGESSFSRKMMRPGDDWLNLLLEHQSNPSERLADYPP